MGFSTAFYISQSSFLGAEGIASEGLTEPGLLQITLQPESLEKEGILSEWAPLP